MCCRVYSLGHSTKPFDDFVRLVSAASIDVVCDIRRFPRSRRHPHFARERLQHELPARGIDYEWLGSELGGFRDEGYEAWMRSGGFVAGIERLEELAAEQTVAFMCSEGLPWKCHRLFVARELAGRGHHVSHLLPDATVVAEQTPLSPPDR
jgi:uncharacterized protein (DUF488 family)